VTQRRNQNSILVLATLGVYLGLVLAGATPQVLAQAAMTKQFSVKDENGQGNDLDKDPETSPPEGARESLVVFSADEFAEAYVRFIINEIVADGQPEITQRIGELDFDVGGIGRAGTFSSELESALGRARNGNARKSTGWKVRRSYGAPTVLSPIELRYELEASERAAITRSFKSCRGDSLTSKFSAAQCAILSNSGVKGHTRHLIIVTRLPRSSIDPLIALGRK